MEPAPIVIVANVWVKEGHLDRVLELLDADAVHTHEHEPGARLFAVHKDVDDPLHLTIVEAYTDEAALLEHRASDVYKTVMAELPGLIGARDRFVLEPLGLGSPGRGYVA